MTDTQRLRDAWADVREHIAAIAELHDVIAVEMGGHTDVEGAVGGAIRIMRTQRAVIEQQRREMVQLVAEINPTFNQRAAMARETLHHE